MTSTNALAEHREGNTHFGFAIPVRDALWVADQLRTEGQVARAYLGVRLEPRSPASFFTVSKPEQSVKTIAATSDSTAVPESSPEPRVQNSGDEDDSPNEGAMIREVLSDTPASQAGLRPGDQIIELDGQPIRSAHDLTDRLDRISARAIIILGIVRRVNLTRQRLFLSLRTANRPRSPIALRADPPVPSLINSPAKVTATAAATTQSFSTQVSTLLPATATIQTGRLARVPSPQPDDLRLTLPQTVVERIEKLERRLELLESALARSTYPAAAAEPRIGSTQHP